MPVFAATVFISAFLLFTIQPMVAKFLLPTFGGTAAVWSTCLVLFQLLLLGGYTYAHILRTKLSPLAQRWTHLGLLAVAMLFLPPAPTVPAGADTGGLPVWVLLRCLLASISVPFFALSATAPLLMEWFRHAFPERTADRLYAFSNAGSLLALLAYPGLLEPNFTRSTQARLWSGGMAGFFVVCAVVAWRSREANRGTSVEGSNPAKGARTSPLVHSSLPSWLWVALPACGSGLLLAVTQQISQDVAPMPLLWVAPMAVYLLTFILCFEGKRTYKRSVFIPGCFLSFLLLAWLLNEGYLQGFWTQVGGYLAVLFVACMVCHGELYRLRPPAERLTAYYLAVSLGGALGGVFVALVAPVVFKTLLETPLIAVTVAAIISFILGHEAKAQAAPAERAKRGQASFIAVGGTLIIALSFGYVLYDQRKESIHFARNFYGIYRVKEGPTLLLSKMDFPLRPGPARVLLSGQIYHGLQFTDPEAAKTPTAYFCEEGGLGLAFRELPAQTNRHIGVIGLGAGTVAAYGRPGDHIRFFELNPEVLHLAQTWFTFLTNSRAHVDVVLGDGRRSLEREPAQNFDLLVLDAFAGDSIPIHLLTDQAMQTYKRHLKSNGVMAFHISNSHLDLVPVVQALADQHGLSTVTVPPKLLDPNEGKLASLWMLLSADSEFLNRPALAEPRSSTGTDPTRQAILWTDDYSSILPILH